MNIFYVFFQRLSAEPNNKVNKPSVKVNNWLVKDKLPWVEPSAKVKQLLAAFRVSSQYLSYY